MTIQETRQLGIEFERRVQTMIPQKELIEKLDTETIYSFLNQYQDKLIHDLYRTVDQIPVSNTHSYIEALLQSMITNIEISHPGNTIIDSYTLPNNFGLYIDSFSEVSKSYEYKGDGDGGFVHNELIAAKDVSKMMPSPQDSMRIIRTPMVWLDKNELTGRRVLGAIYDRYTTPVNLHLTYYKVPSYMNLMTSTPCELPMEMFEQLVSGAVDLYVQYVAGAEANRKRQAQQQQQQQKNNNEE